MQKEALVIMVFGKHPIYLIIDGKALINRILFGHEKSTKIHDKTRVDY